MVPSVDSLQSCFDALEGHKTPMALNLQILAFLILLQCFYLFDGFEAYHIVGAGCCIDMLRHDNALRQTLWIWNIRILFPFFANIISASIKNIPAAVLSAPHE